MLPEVIGAHSDWVFHVGTLCDGGRSMDRDQVWSEPPSVGDIGRQ